MHGWIIDTSVWLLAESTRLLSHQRPKVLSSKQPILLSRNINIPSDPCLITKSTALHCTPSQKARFLKAGINNSLTTPCETHSAVRKPSKTNLNKLRYHKTPSPQTTLAHRLQHFALLDSVAPGATTHQTISGNPDGNYPGEQIWNTDAHSVTINQHPS